VCAVRVLVWSVSEGYECVFVFMSVFSFRFLKSSHFAYELNTVKQLQASLKED